MYYNRIRYRPPGDVRGACLIVRSGSCVQTAERKQTVMSNRFPPYIVQILSALTAAGYEAYVVGGAVRDLLSGQTPGDFDVTTSARPEQVCEIASRKGWKIVDKLGQNMGVVVVVVDGHGTEVATFRGERYSTDVHRPAEVWFCDNLRDDLSRRDFTVNAWPWTWTAGSTTTTAARKT